jgi:DMSO reductase anchor subunit
VATGIVKHLDDQCIGCRYCTLACPYDVPKYHHGKGIVRKCDMCSTRLAAGEAPACVQACPSEAIAIRTVSARQVIADCETSNLLPAAPDPRLTLPTTTYKSRRVFPRNTVPADYHRVVSQHSHWPLVAMLVLTQLSVGAFAVGIALEQVVHFEHAAGSLPLHTAASAFFGLLAIAASVFHLGRPLYAFRAVVGLAHSWLSREIVAFGAFAALACGYAGSTWHLEEHAPAWSTALGWAVVATGLAGVASSTMIYAFTGREFWSVARTGSRFLLTTAQLGIAAVWLTLVAPAAINDGGTASNFVGHASDVLCRALISVTLLKLTIESADFRHLASRHHTSLKRSARLMVGELSSVTLARFACGFLGGIAMPLILLKQQSAPDGHLSLLIAVAMLFAACLAGELLERSLFFRAVAAPRMPGEIRR